MNQELYDATMRLRGMAATMSAMASADYYREKSEEYMFFEYSRELESIVEMIEKSQKDK